MLKQSAYLLQLKRSCVSSVDFINRALTLIVKVGVSKLDFKTVHEMKQSLRSWILEKSLKNMRSEKSRQKKYYFQRIWLCKFLADLAV